MLLTFVLAVGPAFAGQFAEDYQDLKETSGKIKDAIAGFQRLAEAAEPALTAYTQNPSANTERDLVLALRDGALAGVAQATNTTVLMENLASHCQKWALACEVARGPIDTVLTERQNERQAQAFERAKALTDYEYVMAETKFQGTNMNEAQLTPTEKNRLNRTVIAMQESEYVKAQNAWSLGHLRQGKDQLKLMQERFNQAAMELDLAKARIESFGKRFAIMGKSLSDVASARSGPADLRGPLNEIVTMQNALDSVETHVSKILSASRPQLETIASLPSVKGTKLLSELSQLANQFAEPENLSVAK